MNNFERFDVAENAEVINKKTVELANVLQLEVDPDDVQELVDYVDGELSNEDLVVRKTAKIRRARKRKWRN